MWSNYYGRTKKESNGRLFFAYADYKKRKGQADQGRKEKRYDHVPIHKKVD
tara:strand:+ start:638 stop:790 length:153 start_codon:yes stop_codon:yes gene_type:complete